MPVHISPNVLILAAILAALAFIIAMFAAGSLLALYLQCHLSNCHVSFFHILAMRLRRIDLRAVLYSHIRASKAGLDLGPNPVHRLEVHTLAGGHTPELVSALITLKGAGIPATWDTLVPFDLAGRDVLAAAHNAQRAKASGSPITLERALASAPRR